MSKKYFVVFLSFLLLLSMTLSACTHDYSQDEGYQSFFLNTDTVDDKEIKNMIIDMFVKYNDENFMGYIDHFNWERTEKRQYVQSEKEMPTRQTYEIKHLSTVLMLNDDTRAQAGVTVVCTIRDCDSGETQMTYQCDIIFTLEKQEGEWIVTQQETDGESYDYLS